MKSRVTLTKKANGRYYLGLGPDDFASFRVFMAKQQRKFTRDTPTALYRIADALFKSARGE